MLLELHYRGSGDTFAVQTETISTLMPYKPTGARLELVASRGYIIVEESYEDIIKALPEDLKTITK